MKLKGARREEAEERQLEDLSELKSLSKTLRDVRASFKLQRLSVAAHSPQRLLRINSSQLTLQDAQRPQSVTATVRPSIPHAANIPIVCIHDLITSLTHTVLSSVPVPCSRSFPS